MPGRPSHSSCRSNRRRLRIHSSIVAPPPRPPPSTATQHRHQLTDALQQVPAVPQPKALRRGQRQRRLPGSCLARGRRLHILARTAGAGRGLQQRGQLAQMLQPGLCPSVQNGDLCRTHHHACDLGFLSAGSLPHSYTLGQQVGPSSLRLAWPPAAPHTPQPPAPPLARRAGPHAHQPGKAAAGGGAGAVQAQHALGVAHRLVPPAASAGGVGGGLGARGRRTKKTGAVPGVV